MREPPGTGARALGLSYQKSRGNFLFLPRQSRAPAAVSTHRRADLRRGLVDAPTPPSLTPCPRFLAGFDDPCKNREVLARVPGEGRTERKVSEANRKGSRRGTYVVREKGRAWGSEISATWERDLSDGVCFRTGEGIWVEVTEGVVLRRGTVGEVGS